MLRRVLAVLSPRWRNPSSCEGCGAAFTCGASVGGCWCMKVELNDAARARLREQYRRCVCRSCLETEGRLKPAPTSKG